MAEELSNQEEFSVETALGKVKARGSDILTTITLVMVCIIAYGGWAHTVEAKDSSRDFIAAMKESTKVQREQIAVQREANCLARLTSDERKNPREIEFCGQLGKER